MPFLENAYAKAERSKGHLDILKTEMKSFVQNNPVRITTEDDPKKGLHILYLKLPMPNERLALIVGDFIYCLRASLDYLVFELTMLETEELRIGRVRNRQDSQFPVFYEWDTANQKRFFRYLRGLPAEAIRLIDLLQPYHYGNAYKDSLIWQLNQLCNIDKHRRLTTAAADFTFRFGYKKIPIISSKTLDDGAAMLTIPLSYKSEMKLDPVRAFSGVIKFGDNVDGPIMGIGGLDHLYKYVTNEVLPQFKRFFAEPKNS